MLLNLAKENIFNLNQSFKNLTEEMVQLRETLESSATDFATTHSDFSRQLHNFVQVAEQNERDLSKLKSQNEHENVAFHTKFICGSNQLIGFKKYIC